MVFDLPNGLNYYLKANYRMGFVTLHGKYLCGYLLHSLYNAETVSKAVQREEGGGHFDCCFQLPVEPSLI